ncbi:MAG TPA: WG repeat-containing protein [Cyclobacteriaceae bacterium]|nr:WG repeat-containing protein [Cyclobacteriaceae bacterium]
MKTLLNAALFIILTILVCRIAIGQDKKSIKYLNKNEYTSLNEYLGKKLRKDTLNPEVYFTRSLLFSQSLNPEFNLDSAYKNILIACRLILSSDEKRQLRLAKSGITDISINNQQEKVEALAFDHAKSSNSVEDYNYFIQNYPSARQNDEAVALRNLAAFEHASSLNTFQAYLEFVKTYPSARQAPEAQERYDDLIFSDFTGDGQLQSYERFAYNFPSSSHWEEAVRNIFELSTISNTGSSYIDFIKRYPGSRYAPVAASYLYFSAIDKSWISEQKGYDFQFIDSIKAVISLDSLHLFPVLENNRYGFMDTGGRVIIPPQYKNIDPTYLCGNILHSFLLVWNDSAKFIVARNGDIIYNEDFYNVEDLGKGLIKLSREAKYGIIHISGHPILPFEYDEAGLVGGKFIKARIGNNWSLFSFTGRNITSEGFSDIRDEGNFIILVKSDKIAVLNSDEIIRMRSNPNFRPSFEYDDVELIDDALILCMAGKKECLINEKLEHVIPYDEQLIYSHMNGWLAKKGEKYDLYDGRFMKISGSGLTDMSYKGNWITGKNKNKWILYHRFAPVPDEFMFDSVAILDPDFVIVMNGRRTEVMLGGFRKIPLNAYAGYGLLEQAQVSIDDPFVRYMVLHKKNGHDDILSHTGKIIFSGKFEFLKSLGDHYFLVRKKDKYGLLDGQGKELIKPLYDGIANYRDGFVTTFNGREFGLANPLKNIEIQPKFSIAPEPYNDRYFIVREGFNIGIIDRAGQYRINTTGEKIEYWNDTACVIIEEKIGRIVTINSGKVAYDLITSFGKISGNSSETFYLVKAGPLNQYGILSDVNGLVVNISFTDILNIGTTEGPVYFAEKYIQEADIYIVIYYAPDGSVIRKQVYSPEEYEKIYCR